MRVFIGGIMQGSRLDHYIDEQDYRQVIAEAVLARYPETEIVDPNELHPDGVNYNDELAGKTLLELFDLAESADLVVAYVPKASMGTAIEMWQGFQSGSPVVTISPMTANWVVKYISSVVLPDLDAFQVWIAGGGLDNLINLD